MNTQVAITESIKKPWWNRPLWGDRGLIDSMFLLINNKKEIPQEMLYFHNQAWRKLEILSTTLKALLNEEFNSQDFVIFARLNGYLFKCFEENNQYFNQLAGFIQVILKHLDSLSILAQVEANFQQDSLQKLYQFTEALAHQKVPKLVFQEKLRKEKKLIFSHLENAQQREAVETYVNQLYFISQYPQVFENYLFLKRNKLDRWPLLNKLGDFIKNKYHNNLSELKAFVLIAKANDSWFEQLNKAFGFTVPKEASVTDAKILQYLALAYKYESLYPQFKRFLIYLSQWEKTYCYVVTIREKYPLNSYHHPLSFKQNIPGFDLYKTYHDYLDSSYMLHKI